MKFYIVIPAHNEAAFLNKTLQSLTQQTLLPKQVVVVNDNSSDMTEQIIDDFSAIFPFIKKLNATSSNEHLPGSKVIQAFYKGFNVLDDDFDVVMKLDADIILPEKYLETLAKNFKTDDKLGMCSGLCYIEKDGEWIYEPIADKTHIRGPIKAYTKSCFETIGGPKISIGWDTLDVLLAQFHGFHVKTISTLHVKHLKPTGNVYSPKAKFMQGEAMYKMRYGFILTFIASVKSALKQKKLQTLQDNLKGFFEAKHKKTPFLVTPEEGVFIRKFRYDGIKKKLF
ncbi:glycosyltransferase family 2 protein [Zhouia sp. PK063]|uniref:glycosyltransferase family 2 protein n=1 Tax=Zhouia sp. PK063 TaxID=3373602 RepID=UPI0037AE85D2